mmetsp:Transcript_39271/g.39988  ORF Transcript_39271/g.39988 Transcript_39271/m.39988 type:complete len:501 (-) Transcript_39271:316-1818(-)
MSNDNKKFSCLVCFDSLEKAAVIGECGHKACCARCFVVNRRHFDKKDCIVCKEKLFKVVITTEPDKEYSYFNLNALLHSKKADAYFDDKSQLSKIEQLFGIICPSCKKEFSTASLLKQHVQDIHRKSFCQTCFKKRKVFIYEQRLYSDRELWKHQKEGDPAVDQDGAIPVHVKCRLCREWLLDETDASAHMIQHHHCCQVCRRLGKGEKWLTNEEDLVQHYALEHLTCDHQDCTGHPLENVFETELSLQTHIIKTHLSAGSRYEQKKARRLPLDFQYSSSLRSSSPSLSLSLSSSSSSSFLPPNTAQSLSLSPSPSSDALSLSSSLYSSDRVEAGVSLMSEMTRVLGQEALHKFRQLSVTLCKGDTTPQEYYAEYNRLFRGDVHAGGIWMQLVSSLPSFSLRQELSEIHYKTVQEGGGFNIDHKTVSVRERERVCGSGIGKTETEEEKEMKGRERGEKGESCVGEERERGRERARRSGCDGVVRGWSTERGCELSVSVSS